ncbi:MAG: AAA family ATPase, partial [candidate division Zixibacteria bacterium]|nr:AAA family ATPase [candidate division Zixibacteria bacterium]
MDKLEIRFEKGMNVLTGETGAGKSIIVGAIGRLLGERADKDDIRSGANLAVIEGDFDISGRDSIAEILKKIEISCDDARLTLRKEIPFKGNSKSFINNQLVTLAQSREITKQLAELFGQHSHQQLLDEDNHLGFLDRFAGLFDKVADLQEIYSRWNNMRKELTYFESRREFEKNERELIIFQKEEIEKGE